MSIKLTRTAAAAALALGYFMPAPIMAAGTSYHFLYQHASRPIPGNARVYVLQGYHTPSGCHYDYPDVTLPADGRSVEVQDLGIDVNACAKLVAEGTPESHRANVNLQLLTESVIGPAVALPSASSPNVVTHTSRYFQRLWYEDVIGKVLTGDTTRITWTWDGSCAVAGSVDQIVEYFGLSGWSLESNSASRSLSCSYLYGNTVATFANRTFCGSYIPVWSYYYYNRVYGRGNGTATLSYSDDMINECLPVWEHRSYGIWVP